MSNLFGAIVCVICFALANFGFEAFRQVPNYLDAAHLTWNQLWAIGTYYVFWVKE